EISFILFFVFSSFGVFVIEFLIHDPGSGGIPRRAPCPSLLGGAPAASSRPPGRRPSGLRCSAAGRASNDPRLRRAKWSELYRDNEACPSHRVPRAETEAGCAACAPGSPSSRQRRDARRAAAGRCSLLPASPHPHG